MDASYRKISEISFKHDYFNASDFLEKIQIHYPEKNRTHYGILIKELNGKLFIAKKASTGELPNGILYFYLFFGSPGFKMVTPLNTSIDEVLYFDLENVKEETISGDAARNIPVQHNSFTYKLDSNEEDWNAIKLINPLGENKSELIKVAENRQDFSFNLAEESEGIYQFEIDRLDKGENTTYTFFYIGNLDRQHISAIVSYPTSVDTDLNFTISFQTRLITYKYYFLNLTEEDWAGATFNSIIINGKEVTLEKEKEKTILGNGSEAYIARSTALIPLQEKAIWSPFQITTSKMGGGIQLPYASVEGVRKEEGRDEFYSEIYVYL